ncbi:MULTISPECIES: single-stranded-DNA-specific exonuclease RecJ [unclassified Oscillibacter]|uniref:single-stranded-DNA-specific exonuclease RecJ n=1 Tax=unclassified Oscillibacter TaxID=2629304 RepID=UPI0025FDE5BB|nr:MULTISPECIES: single-stranded-DNA-specific exonuclease RecJ [unclassified Oscillibacter]
MKFEKWNIGAPSPGAVEALRQAGYPALLASVLAGRGIVSAEEAAKRLECDGALTLSPFAMADMDKAVERIRRAIADGETVAVFGDYDVDGITSTVLLLDYLKNCGVPCLRYIPRRIEDGYGLSREAIQFLRDQGATLMVTVDCGVTGAEEVDFAASLGLDVVVTDHHECKGPLPKAAAVVDPHRADCPYPFKHLAGVGVALKLVLALGGSGNEERLFSRYCTLAAIGTVADVMRMEGENRVIVQRGLAALPRTDFVGIHALLKEAGLDGKPVTSVQIGFSLAPRINAAGRMGAADLAADLLETEDPARAEELARALCDLNRERQAVEQEICADALHQIESLPDSQRSALVLDSDDWHQGVVGIVASRISEKFSCPSFMIHIQDNLGKGSCRSFGGFNLFAALEACSSLLDGFGGHELAAGFTIRKENIAPFREKMNGYVRAHCGKGIPVPALEIDVAVADPADLTMDEVEQLGHLDPYGAGNPRPVFALLGARVEGLQGVGQGKHLKLQLSRGLCRFDAIFFSATAEEYGIRVGDRVDAAFYLQGNTFRGRTTLQLQMVDLRLSRVPSRSEVESLEMIRRLCCGESLTAQETDRLNVSLEQFRVLLKAIRRLLPQGRATVARLPFLRSVAELSGGREAFLRAALALAVFEERELLRTTPVDEEFFDIALLPWEDSVDLCACPLLQRLHAGAQVWEGREAQ